MAVRIVDLSSMVNANVGTSLIDSSGAFASPDEPRGSYPSELDFGNFVYSMAELQFAGTGTTRMTGVANLMQSRQQYQSSQPLGVIATASEAVIGSTARRSTVTSTH